jgi:signal peptidase I
MKQDDMRDIDAAAKSEALPLEETVDAEPGIRIRSFIGYTKTVLLTLFVALVLKSFVVEAFRIPSSSMENTLQVGDFLLVNKLAYGIRSPRYVPLTNLAVPTFFIPAFKSVRRGDVLVFEFPGAFEEAEHQEHVNYIKRCVGLPGDVVEIRGARVLVNGQEMLFPRSAKAYGRASSSWHSRSRLFPRGAGFSEDEYGPLVVPKRGDVIELNATTLRLWRGLIQREGHTVGRDPNGAILIDGKAATSYTVERNHYFVMGDNRYNSLDSRYWGFVPEQNLIGEALFVYWSWDPDVSVKNVVEKIRTIRWSRIGTMIR